MGNDPLLAGREPMEAAVLMALANQSHTRKSQEKKGGKTDFPETKSIQRDLVCQSVSPTGSHGGASQCRGGYGGNRTKRNPVISLQEAHQPQSGGQSQAGGQPHGRTSRASCALGSCGRGSPSSSVVRWSPSTMADSYLRRLSRGQGDVHLSPDLDFIGGHTGAPGIHPSRARTDGESSA